MARFQNLRKYVCLAYALIVFLQVFLMFKVDFHQNQDSSKSKRELRYNLNNSSIREQTSISNHQQSVPARQVMFAAPLQIARSWTPSRRSYTNTTGINVSNSVFRQDNVTTKQMFFKHMLDVKIKRNNSISGMTKAPELSSWIPDSTAINQSAAQRETVTTPLISKTVSLHSVSINLNYSITTGINDRAHVSNTEIRPTNHKNMTEMNDKNYKNGLISETKEEPKLPSWIPANIINLSESDISEIYECSLNPSENSEILATKNKLPICPCVPNNLEKHIFSKEHLAARYKEMQSKYKDVSPGGHWAPQTCVPRHSIAMIVPYRDRDDHLVMFLDYMHRLLQKQLLDYTIIVAEQGAPSTFNKAKLMNAAYLESKKIKSFDCYVFHDIDMFPEDERNLYTCPSMPRHQGVATDKFNYRLVYSAMIGGASVYRPEHFELINGYSNKFWGWGGEDDNMFRRIVAKNLKVLRPPEKLARYTMVKHDLDEGNPRNGNRMKLVDDLMEMQDCDGLNKLRYKTFIIRKKRLYTWMLFDITDSPAPKFTFDVAAIKTYSPMHRPPYYRVYNALVPANEKPLTIRDKPPVILYWTLVFGQQWTGLGVEPFKIHNCNCTCELTVDKSRFSESSAIIVHPIYDVIEPFPKKRLPWQRFVFLISESPHNTPSLEQYASVFNWTMTYRRDSDIFSPYGGLIRKNDVNHKYINYAEGKTKLVVMISSNCNPVSRRQYYVKHLSQFIQVDDYGKCFSKERCPGECDVVRKYKFYLSFENSICKDYITEKLWKNALLAGLVPVVLGGSNYRDILPPQSFIDVGDYNSPKELADYLIKVAANDTLYNSYFKWKQTFQVGYGKPYDFLQLCDLCYKIQNDAEYKVYHDLEGWWKSSNCLAPEQKYLKLAKYFQQ